MNTIITHIQAKEMRRNFEGHLIFVVDVDIENGKADNRENVEGLHICEKINFRNDKKDGYVNIHFKSWESPLSAGLNLIFYNKEIIAGKVNPGYFRVIIKVLHNYVQQYIESKKKYRSSNNIDSINDSEIISSISPIEIKEIEEQIRREYIEMSTQIISILINL